MPVTVAKRGPVIIGGMADEVDYVTMASWLREVGRPDHVDEIADQFERPTRSDIGHSWPRRSRGWRSADRLRPHPARERVAD